MDTKNITSVKSRAYANIALIKYWGKKDPELMLPFNSSVSLTLADLYTDTEIKTYPELNEDRFYLNGKLQDLDELVKIIKIVNIFRTGQQPFVEINSINNMPTAAGVSSSSSGIAALVIACNKFFQTNYTHRHLSRIARLGSGSACRSLFPGLVKWQTSDNDLDCYAEQIPSDLDLSMLFIIVSAKPKAILSRTGMAHCVATSAYYPAWVDEATKDYQKMLAAIADNDFLTIGKLTEESALKMHATTLAAKPPFSYLNSDSFLAMERLEKIKKDIDCFYTMDAGPNVKVLCKTSDLSAVKQKLLQFYPFENIITSRACKNVEL